MLVSSKNKHEKIVLGLLSYTYDEEVPSTEVLKQDLTAYQESQTTQILLYKPEGADNFIGLIILDKEDGEDLPQSTLYLQKYVLLPSFRDEESAYEMFKALKAYYPEAKILSNMQLSDHLAGWTQRYEKDRLGDE
ncbi:hypothetical protein CL176_07495 [Suicoccus acidiformans]|uniref:N-acetyltransferase domain-containing protein n=1 Tax=Suicoccus acidiformans TaxID=2036206 RepID=A0A347WL97_9LACT|nr:hypothetical protein [Suicoccus acidiformans]AXY25854.1 hypothetical protein CL176_07495 [Suicoccus acidiformans]